MPTNKGAGAPPDYFQGWPRNPVFIVPLNIEIYKSAVGKS
jgi:hypothetical protein